MKAERIFGIIAVLLTGMTISLFAGDKKDVAVYKKEKNFWGKEKTILTMDFSHIKHPPNPEAFDAVYHSKPIRQDTTGTCWCFSATSMLESEIYRLSNQKINLSRMFVVYWEYVEKVRRFVQKKGDSRVSEGSQANAVTTRMKQYGIVPASDYTGLVNGATKYNHAPMIKEIKKYLSYVKENNLWYEDQVIANVRMILDRYMGRPPEEITYDGVKMTPKEFLNNVTKLPLDDYVCFISFKKIPFWTQDAYDVPDNWWKNKDYYNVPLDDFYNGIKTAIQNGYSVVLAGDVTEPGKHGQDDLAVIPTFDIPSKYINQDAREFRFYNKTTGDDHGIHLVGYKKYAGQDWYLIKDSASSGWKGKFNGYHFFSGDYIKLKILAFMVHKDGVKKLLEKFEKNKPNQDNQDKK